MLLGSAPTVAAALVDAERLLTVREVAAALRIRPVTVYKLCATGELPHLRISNAIRILPKDLSALLRSAEQGKRTP